MYLWRGSQSQEILSIPSVSLFLFLLVYVFPHSHSMKTCLKIQLSSQIQKKIKMKSRRGFLHLVSRQRPNKHLNFAVKNKLPCRLSLYLIISARDQVKEAIHPLITVLKCLVLSSWEIKNKNNLPGQNNQGNVLLLIYFFTLGKLKGNAGRHLSIRLKSFEG